ncbi:MAG: hypothetical protein JWM11_1015 [Planctomycetaceae bacterium]|nr:hypothetical protein [Planctomycetaceae bacterium]
MVGPMKLLVVVIRYKGGITRVVVHHTLRLKDANFQAYVKQSPDFGLGRTQICGAEVRTGASFVFDDLFPKWNYRVAPQ